MKKYKSEICEFDSCQQPRKSRGYCAGHYRQNQLGKALTPIIRHLPVADRFWLKVEKTDTCWNWTGSKNTTGYGIFKFGGSQMVSHRFSYQLLVSQIPPGMVIDHRCFNKSCVNPEHMKVVTQKQNCENQAGPSKNNKTGVRGVHWHSAKKKFIATIGHNFKRIQIGAFSTLEEAEAAVIAKRNELFTNNPLDRN